MWSQTVRQCWCQLTSQDTDTIWWVNINVLPVALLSDITEQSGSSDKPNKIQIRFHWSAQQTTQDTDFMVYFLGQLSSAPIDQTSSAHPTSDGKFALSALRLTRPDLHSSNIAGNYALPALVNTFSSLQSVCCHRLGLLLTDISHRGEQNAAGCNSGILTTVITKSWFNSFPLAIYSHTAKVSHNILESRMQLGAFQEQNSHHRP